MAIVACYIITWSRCFHQIPTSLYINFAILNSPKKEGKKTFYHIIYFMYRARNPIKGPPRFEGLSLVHDDNQRLGQRIQKDP